MKWVRQICVRCSKQFWGRLEATFYFRCSAYFALPIDLRFVCWPCAFGHDSLWNKNKSLSLIFHAKESGSWILKSSRWAGQGWWSWRSLFDIKSTSRTSKGSGLKLNKYTLILWENSIDSLDDVSFSKFQYHSLTIFEMIQFKMHVASDPLWLISRLNSV